MQEPNSNKHQDHFNDGIDLIEIFYVLLQGKWIVISLTAFVTIAGVIYSLFLPNIYESKALLVPVNSSSSISRALGSYSGIAGFAGINLPYNKGQEGNSAKALKKITTLSFFTNNIFPKIYLPDLMAVKTWNSKTNTLVFDKDIFDSGSSEWIKDGMKSEKNSPSIQESHRAFKQHLNLVEDNKTGFIILSIKHQSPYIAKQWAELIVNEVNNFYKLKDQSESEKAAAYLNLQISLTSLSEIKEVLAQLLQEETKQLTLIEAKEFYVFEYIDPPAVMEQKTDPSRAFIGILSVMFGAILSIALVIIKHYLFKKKTL